MTDEEWIDKVNKINDPLALLKEWYDARDMLCDRYYRDLLDVLLDRTKDLLNRRKI